MLYVPLFLHLAMSMQHPEWLADHYLTGGQIFRHHGTRANFDIITQRHRADDHHVGAEFDAVSYTHLDVYKRQAEQRVAAHGEWFINYRMEKRVALR